MSTRSPGEATSRIAHFDALRGWAILLVIVCHVGGLMGSRINQLTGEGNKGVELFYMLSAFMLFWTHYNRHSREASETRNFFIRRFFRIAPLFYVVIIAWTVYYKIANPSLAPTLKHVMATMLFVNGWVPAWINSIIHVEWSVAVEMTFYLMMPMLLRYITNVERAFVLTVAGMLVGNELLKWLLGYPKLFEGYEWYPEFWFPAHMGTFFIGITAFFLSRAKIDVKYGPLLVFLGAFVLLCSYKGDELWVIRHQYMFAIGFAILAIGLGIRPYSAIVNRWTVLLGKISFSAYLIHLPVVIRVKALCDTHTHLSGWIEFGVVLALSILIVSPIAMLTYRWIEVPGIAIGNRLIKHLSRVIVTRSNEQRL